MAGIFARKLEMTRIIKENAFIPVTLLEIPEMQVVGYKTQEKDGYSAIVIGALKKANITPKSPKDFSVIKEFSIDQSDEKSKEIGTFISLDELENVETVSLKGVSKGKGFAGAMKRHNFGGGRATHGSKFHRALGSIGSMKPTGTHKGKKMHGHYGVDTISLRDVPVSFVNKNANILALKGPIPGARNSLIQIFI